jgi:hypothetical protein
VIAALDPDEAKYCIFHLSDDVFAAIEARTPRPLVIEEETVMQEGKRALV